MKAETNYAPIVMFTYCRPEHTKKAVESILKNPESALTDIYIYSDAPKTEEKKEGVKRNRAYIHKVTGFKKVTIIERDHNWGLANSVIDGVSTVIKEYGKVIVIEDDLLVSPFFLKYMNDALELYEKEDSVATISGFTNPTGDKLPNTFFLKYFACWGWGTWERAWKLFNPNASQLIETIRHSKSQKIFDFDYHANFFEMLELQNNGKIDSWAIRFYASLYTKGKINLFPHTSLVKQTGIDGTGVHCGNNSNFYELDFPDEPIDLSIKPELVQNRLAYSSFKRFYFRLLSKRGKIRCIAKILFSR